MDQQSYPIFLSEALKNAVGVMASILPKLNG